MLWGLYHVVRDPIKLEESSTIAQAYIGECLFLHGTNQPGVLKSIESGADTGCFLIGLRSKVVHYIGNMVQFGTQTEPLRPVLALSIFVKKGDK